jgi:type 1 glutamine amidotransferase
VLRRQFLGAASLAASARAADLRIQLTTGGHAHDISFYGVFEGNADFRINVNPHPLAFRRDFRKSTDVLVLYDMVDLNESEQGHVRAFLESGKGLVVLHHALCGNWRWRWWYEEVVGGRYLMADEGEFKKSRFKHDERMAVTVAARHPVVEGIAPFEVVDETYGGMWVSPRSKVLLESVNATGDRQVAWIGPYDKSRVVAIQLGHGPEAHRHPSYRRLVANAIRWSAGGRAL